MSDSSDGIVRATTGGKNIPPEERRQSPRYKLRDARAIMRWDEGSEHVACDVEVLNISGTGIAVVGRRAPPVGLCVRLQFETRPTAQETLEAWSLATGVDPYGRLLVRMQFTHWVSLDVILRHHEDRRLWQRFPVRQTRAKLNWLEGGSETTVRGELSNISGGGAAIIIDAIPPADVPLWFELELDGRVLDRIESRLVTISLDPSGSKIVRIKFIEPCPMLLFELAIQGST